MRHLVVARAALAAPAVSRIFRPVTCAAAFALVALAGAGHAAADPSPLAMPLDAAAAVAYDAGEPFAAAGYGEFETTASGSGLVFAPAGRRLEAVRWRPRRDRGYRSRGPQPEGFSQLHAGFMDPDGRQSAGLVLGYRGGLAIDPAVHIGGMVDWRHRSNAETAVISEGPGPGGTTITTRADLSRSSSDLVPILGFVQVSVPGASVIPYFGLAGGYEVLHLSAEDFFTGLEYRGTFDGFGWQTWAGVAFPLSGRARLAAEVFVNRAELSREVTDALTGFDVRETVDMDGNGMRFGLQWGF